MRKSIVASAIMAVALLTWGFFAPGQPQDPANQEKPTFYRLTPGVYVNGWPRFTVTYPKDWVERRPDVIGLFRATPSGSAPWEEGLAVWGLPNPPPLDKYGELLVPYFRSIATDVTVLTDKPSRLQDGTLARELEFKAVRNTIPRNWLCVATIKGEILISVFVGTHKGTIGEHLRAIAYSIEFDPGKDEPVKVPPDIQEFLDRYCSANVSHDFSKLKSHFSDRYLNSGERKEEVVRKLKPLIDRITSFEIVITDFIPASDKAYLTGFTIGWWEKAPLNHISIIKESSEWKWYGNQRDVIPEGSTPK